MSKAQQRALLLQLLREVILDLKAQRVVATFRDDGGGGGVPKTPLGRRGLIQGRPTSAAAAACVVNLEPDGESPPHYNEKDKKDNNLIRF
jgi:hypothetical protein